MNFWEEAKKLLDAMDKKETARVNSAVSFNNRGPFQLELCKDGSGGVTDFRLKRIVSWSSDDNGVTDYHRLALMQKALEEL